MILSNWILTTHAPKLRGWKLTPVIKVYSVFAPSPLNQGGMVLWNLGSVLDSWAVKPSCNFLQFPALRPLENRIFCRKVHVSAGKYISVGKPDFLQLNGSFYMENRILLQFALGVMVVCFWMIWVIKEQKMWALGHYAHAGS